jgi:hypothetical protein
MGKSGTDHKTARDLGFSLLSEGRVLRIKAGGYSMYPFIRPETTIFIAPGEDLKNIVPGDIIAWKREQGFVVHRLIRIEKRENEILYYTRGDSCRYEDRPVTGEGIAGKVIRTEDRRNRIKEGDQLRKKPFYSINRITVRLITGIKHLTNKLSAIFVKASGPNE